jgi:hypothetical protein
VERKHDNKGKVKQLPRQPEQPPERQARMLRRRERQGNVDIEKHEVDVEIRQEAANMEGKQGEGRVKQLPKRPEQPEPPQAGHSRVLRKRERR